MSQVPFHYLDLRTFCYATEHEERVEEALRMLLPPDTEIERSRSSGHHGDRIIVLTVRLERANEMRHVLERLTGAEGFDRVLARLTDRVDEDCAFFVRIDKQRAFEGDVTFGQGIQLRGKVEAYPASREAAIENLTAYFSS